MAAPNSVSPQVPQKGNAVVAVIPVAVSGLAQVNAGTTSEQTITVTGAAVGDSVTVNKPTHQSGLGIVGARVSAANTVAITFMATAGGNVTPTAETYIVRLTRAAQTLTSFEGWPTTF